jgi:hypothetical protein
VGSIFVGIEDVQWNIIVLNINNGGLIACGQIIGWYFLSFNMVASTEEGAEESTLIEEGTTMPNLGITV